MNRRNAFDETTQSLKGIFFSRWLQWEGHLTPLHNLLLLMKSFFHTARDYELTLIQIATLQLAASVRCASTTQCDCCAFFFLIPPLQQSHSTRRSERPALKRCARIWAPTSESVEVNVCLSLGLQSKHRLRRENQSITNTQQYTNRPIATLLSASKINLVGKK